MRARSQLTRQLISEAREILDPQKAMTLRHLFYILVSRHTLKNTEREYKKLARVMALARMNREIDFDCLVDNLRVHIKPSSWSGLSDFAGEVAETYREDLWRDQPHYIEFWIEKDAIAGVVGDVTWEYDVKVRPLRGYSSLSFIRQAAAELASVSKPIFIYYLGDHDPSGCDIERASREGLCKMFSLFGWPRSKVMWSRVALLAADLKCFNIIPLPAKKSDARFLTFARENGTSAAELDALPPEELTGRIKGTILKHLEAEKWQKLQLIEAAERESFQRVMAPFLRKR